MAQDAGQGSFEENITKLEGVLKKLEDENTPLEEAFDLYKEGMETLKTCREKISLVEQKVKELKDSGDLVDFKLPKKED